jgi:hypothetical protein
VLSLHLQTFGETLFTGMSLADFVQAAAEILGRPVLVSDCLEV